MATDNHYDVLIIGGGLVGASLAVALSATTLRTAVVEAVPLGVADQPSYDDRTLALAWGSRRVFEAMNLWQAMEPGACAIEHIHISDRGRFGFTRLQSADAGLPALGYVVETRAMGKALFDRLHSETSLSVFCPAEVVAIDQQQHGAVCTVTTEAGEQTLHARLVVVAEGGRSSLREQLGFQTARKDYGQTAIVTNVTPEKFHEHTAYERFTSTGPLALLPMGQERCAVVWSTTPEQVDEIMGWDDEVFLARLQERFGYRLGEFKKVGKRQAYPLALSQPDAPTRDRVVLIGNAAHTVHPVAGQGFNLGLRDVATLAQVLVEADDVGEDIGSEAVLQRYVDWRARDTRRVSRFTDSLIHIFSNDALPLALGRNLGLIAVDMCPPLKRMFTRRTSGLTGRLPRLARGLPLVN